MRFSILLNKDGLVMVTVGRGTYTLTTVSCTGIRSQFHISHLGLADQLVLVYLSVICRT